MARKKTTIQKLKAFTEYGIHIWAILILANAALVYAFHFSTQASQKVTQENIIQDTDNGQPVEDNGTDLQKPKGQIIDLTFTVPGIGSGGGTMQPKRLKRNITVYLYSRDVNSLNNTVKPLYTIKSTVNYENDKDSPLYTTFSNHSLDLGVDVKEGEYQIAFRTDESLRTVIKESPEKVGGQLFGISNGGSPLILPIQTVLMGDTIPKEGDNTIDMSDYNAFINCFGERNNSDFCSQSNYGDFDDNGVIDGVDYNVLLLTFRSLLKQGQSIPQITGTPVSPGRQVPLAENPSPTKKVKVSPTQKPVEEDSTAQQSGSGGAILGVIFLLFFFIIAGVFGFLFFKNEQFRNKIKALIHLSPTGTPAATQDPSQATESAETTDQTATPDAAQEPAAEQPPAPPADPAVQSTAQPAENPEEIASSTEIPVDQLAKQPEQPDGTIEKSCYIKKRLPDDAKTGFWLTLTDDNGALEAHYTATDVSDGFAKVKGIMKTENEKTYLEISELTPEG